jgi:hypothetical protein
MCWHTRPLLPVFARLGEIGGRKALYLSGFAFFGLWSALNSNGLGPGAGTRPRQQKLRWGPRGGASSDAHGDALCGGKGFESPQLHQALRNVDRYFQVDSVFRAFQGPGSSGFLDERKGWIMSVKGLRLSSIWRGRES